jgi:hypothetical protein
VGGRTIKRLLLSPLHDFIEALGRAMPVVTWQRVVTALAGVVAGWWLYVPAHELLHAFGTIVAGGTVERLEISPEYGAALLQKIFPFVTVGSDYAGQLVGFDTGGSDLVYLSTVWAPYLLTVFIGVPLLREIARRGRPGAGASALLGLSVPVAYASLANVAGDFYELGSIPVSRIVAGLVTGGDPARWRSDDLFLLGARLLSEGSFDLADLVAILSACLLGALCAYATYWLGGAFHELVARAAERRV